MAARDGNRGIARTPTFDEIFAVMSAASVGDTTARVALPDAAALDDPAIKLAIGLNILLDDLAFRFAERERAVLENARLFEAAEARAQQLQALRNIDIAITSSLDLRVTLNVVLDQVATHLQVDAANVRLFDSHSQVLRHATNRGFRTNALHTANLRLGEGHAGRCALERRAIHVPDLSVDPAEFAQFTWSGEEKFVAYYAVPLIAKGEVKGVLEIFLRSPHSATPEWMAFLEALAGQAAIAIDNSTLFDGLQRANVELTLAYDTTLEGWSRALDLRDKETEGHTQRVAELALRLARAMGMRDEEMVHARRGALLHDIGKMGIPDSILLKPGPLSDDEWAIMKKHPVYAYELLSPIPYLRLALDIPYCHHEKWDGTGYPRGLKGQEIPLAARIFAVVDVWDALTSDRPYRKAWPEDKARQHIRDQAGKHFEPRIVEAFLALE
jgi:putative nucleotidyltransferase with HDIG domain